VSNLHKQNFDLKLELFHRRENQTKLEQRIAAVSDENRQLQDMNEEVLEELQKRDKAVEEAVAMIVLLEAQVENLVKEVGVLREAGARDFYRRISQDLESAGRGSTPKLRSTDNRLDRDQVLNRMPSFVSVRSERTENLRNVYLGSLTSLPRPSESQSELDNDRATALASPSMSVLSESSFVSVYGKDKQDGNRSARSPDERPSMDSNGENPPQIWNGAEWDDESRDAFVTPPRPRRSNSITHGTAPGRFQSLENILDQGSPLQRIARLDRTMSLNTDSSRQWTQERELDSHQFSRATNPLSQRKTKEEKREALRRVMTNDVNNRLHDQGLPPTPDTISTSTLRRYKNSNDTLSQQGIASQKSYVALSDSPSANADKHSMEAAASNLVVPVSQPPSMTAFNDRKEVNASSYFENRIPFIQRPRSAGETTTSRRQGNDWESDSENDSDTRSIESSLDIWMREGRKQNRARASGRASPDLFGFPTRTATGTWTSQPAAMYGSFVPDYTSRSDEMFLRDARENPDDVVPVQSAILATTGPPPPPNRRSSLHARTGSTSASAMLNQMQNASTAAPTRRKSPSRRRGHARRNSDDIASRSASSQIVHPLQASEGKQARAKGNHYPPITGQQAPRGRGLNRLFRRSVGSSAQTESAPGSATEATFAAASKAGSIGIPSWMHRSNTGDGERSVTPPPIMRKRMVSGTEDVDAVAPTPKAHAHAVPSTPTAPSTARESTSTAAVPPAATPATHAPVEGGSTRRKWLPGFGRSSSSSKNRAG